MSQRVLIASVLIVVCVVIGLSLTLALSNRGSGLVTVTGTLESGVEAGCVILRADDGTEHLLSGGSDYPPVGTRVTVTGFFDSNLGSYCMQRNAAIHVVSISRSEETAQISISYGTATASTATVINGSTHQSTTIAGASITIAGYIYRVVESPQCYPQCLAPSFTLTYLYVPPALTSTSSMSRILPTPDYYRLLQNGGNPFWTTVANGTCVKVTGMLVAPSSWNCDSLYVPKICLSGDIYVQDVTPP